MTKILHINKGYTLYGGVEEYIRKIVLNTGDFSDELRIDVLAIAKDNKSNYFNVGNSVIRECSLTFKMGSFRFSFEFLFRFLLLYRKYDVLHFHFPNPLGELIVLLISPFTSSRILYTYHNDVTEEKTGSKIYNKFALKALSKADKVVATSPNIFNTSKLLRQIPANKQYCIPLGVAIRKENQSDINDETSGLSLIYVGRLVKLKGVSFLIEAVGNLPNSTLDIVGSGVEMENLKKLAFNLGARVHFHGYVLEERKNELLNNADVLILPSITRGEGFGYVLLEAMERSCALISTELGTGTSYVNINGSTGFVIEPKSSDQLSQAIESYSKDPELLKRHQDNARLRCAEEFSDQKFVQNIISLYRNND